MLRIIAEYQRLVEDAEAALAPRTYIFAGKAAPGYWAAKQIIKLIHSVGNLINNDARVKDRMKVVFIARLSRVAGRSHHARRRS